jgi:hypothetical protein
VLAFPQKDMCCVCRKPWNKRGGIVLPWLGASFVWRGVHFFATGRLRRLNIAGTGMLSCQPARAVDRQRGCVPCTVEQTGGGWLVVGCYASAQQKAQRCSAGRLLDHLDAGRSRGCFHPIRVWILAAECSWVETEGCNEQVTARLQPQAGGSLVRFWAATGSSFNRPWSFMPW